MRNPDITAQKKKTFFRKENRPTQNNTKQHEKTQHMALLPSYGVSYGILRRTTGNLVPPPSKLIFTKCFVAARSYFTLNRRTVGRCGGAFQRRQKPDIFVILCIPVHIILSPSWHLTFTRQLSVGGRWGGRRATLNLGRAKTKKNSCNANERVWSKGS